MALKSMENVYLVCPLGLGDYFICNAIVNHYLVLSHRVILPVPPQYMDTVGCLYSDWDNIELVPYLGIEIENQLIRDRNLAVVNFRTIFEQTEIHFKGFADPITVPLNWDRQMYEHFDWCYSRRYQNFQLPKSIPNGHQLYQKLNGDNSDFVLFHPYTSKHVGGISIDLASWRPAAGLDPGYKIINVEIGHTPNLLDYVELIRLAKEIHVVPSSFYCLVDSVFDQTQAELFLHDIRSDALLQPNCRWNNHRWHIVHYGEKQ